MSSRRSRDKVKDPRVVLSHVCHQWRSVCLGSPRFWCEVDATSEFWTREILARSHKLPLAVLITEARKQASSERMSTRLALEELPRITSLRFAHSNFNSYDYKLKDVVAPVLDALCLYSTIGDPPRLSLPSLTRLDFRGCYGFTWDATHPIFAPSLVHLDIHNANIHTVASLALLLDILRTMPALQTLRLDDVLPTGRLPPAPAASEDRLALPALRALTLGAPANSAAVFLQHVSLPAHAALALELPDWSAGELSERLAPALRARYARRPLHAVHCSASSWRAWAAPHPAERLSHIADPPALRVAYKYALDGDAPEPFSLPAALCTLFAADAQHPLEHAMVGDAHLLARRQDWASLLDALPNLAELAVERPVCGVLAVALTPRSMGREQEVVCNAPGLRTLVLLGADVQPKGSSKVSKLCAMLQKRAKLEHPLARLVVCECEGLEQEDIQELQSMVTVVEQE